MNRISKVTNSIRTWFYGIPAMVPGYYSEQSPTIYASASNALQFTPVYRAVNLISNDLARTPRDFDDANIEQLFTRPNQFQSGFDFLRAVTAETLLYGNSFVLINRRKSGGVYELVHLVQGTVSMDLTAGYPQYKTKDFGVLSADQVIHLKAGIVSGYMGTSPIGVSARAITIAMSQEAAVSSSIESGGNPRLAFIHPNTLNEAARQAISNQYLKNHTGKNSGRPVVLAENMRIEQLSSANEDAGLEAARKYSITDVSRIYGVPVCYLSETGSSVYGSLEWSSRAYLDNCLSHWLETWKAEIFLKLNTVVSFDTDFITRPTLVESYAALRTGVEAGIITPNEARAALDYAPIDGGDDRVLALNMGTGGGQTNIGTDTSKQQDTPSQ